MSRKKQPDVTLLVLPVPVNARGHFVMPEDLQPRRQGLVRTRIQTAQPTYLFDGDLVRRTDGGPPVTVEVGRTRGTVWSSRQNDKDFRVAIRQRQYRDKSQRLYPIKVTEDRQLVDGTYVVTRTDPLNLVGLLTSLDAALDDVERSARFADESAAQKARELRAAAARHDALAMLLVGQGRIAGVALTAQERTDDESLYTIDLRLEPQPYQLFIRDVARLAQWFPDGRLPISFDYGRLRISSVPESMLDALLAKDAHAEV
jgi:hypothetical protein